MKKKVLAFTLAEVLITLSIIGIVAALTIPTLINNYQKRQYVTTLKKSYTIVNQALTQMTSDRDCVNNFKCSGVFEAGTTNDTFGDLIIKYFKIVKNCKTTADETCWATDISDKYDGTSSRVGWGTGFYRFIITDGVAFAFHNFQQGCPDLNWSNKTTNNMSQMCGLVYIDVNGPNKGPNSRGRDIFGFWITNGHGAILYPFGGSDDKYGEVDDWWFTTNGCSPLGNYNGFNCAGRIMEEGWEMNY